MSICADNLLLLINVFGADEAFAISAKGGAGWFVI